MTLLTGLTAQGAEVPVRVDAQGRLVAVADPLGVLPPGGLPGQIIQKTGPGDFEAAWVNGKDLFPPAHSFGMRNASGVSVPPLTASTRLVFPGSVQLLNGANFDPVSGRITPMVAGSWWITASIALVQPSQAVKLVMRFNNSDVCINTKAISGSEYPVILPVNFFGVFNGTTDYISLDVQYLSPTVWGFAAQQVFGTRLAPAGA
jgi:hypothetical protein